MSLVIFDIIIWVSASPFGPVISSHVWSSLVAIDCPRVRLSLGGSRWIIAGKYPSMFEKWCKGIVGVILTCLLVMVVSSMATRSPIIVTMRAASFRVVGIVIVGVFEGRKLDVMISPAMMLPQASRLMGLITRGLFSLMGDSGRNRGDPMVTKNTTRKL